jgi:hypothetical protein
MLQEYVINQAKQQIMMQAEARGEEVILKSFSKCH